MGLQWQDEYRYARAFEQASSDIVKYIIGLKDQYIGLLEKEKEVETSIEES